MTQETNEMIAINEAMATILTQKTPPEVVKTRRGRGGKMLSYVSHDYVTRTLNDAFHFQWSFEVASERLIPEDEPREVIVRGRLTVHTPDGDLTKEQFGGADVKHFKDGQIISLADDLKAASSDSLKKCASLLGLALDLYGSDAPQSQPQPQSKHKATKGSNSNGNQPNNPVKLLEVVNAKVSDYYKNANHLHNALGGWPEFTDSAAVGAAISNAVDHVSAKNG